MTNIPTISNNVLNYYGVNAVQLNNDNYSLLYCCMIHARETFIIKIRYDGDHRNH